MEKSTENSKIKELSVSWQKCYLLLSDWKENIQDDDRGVYIIWGFKVENQNEVIRVGQGNIKERLSEHRDNPEIVDGYEKYEIIATWAKIKQNYFDGVEKWMGETLRPRVCERLPVADMIIVDLPY